MRFLLACALVGAGCVAGVDPEDPAEPDDGAPPVGAEVVAQKVQRITTISYAPNSYVIGNAYPGWTDDIQGDAQFSKGPGNDHGAAYRWGYLFGEGFDRCAWINDNDIAGNAHVADPRCGSPQEIDTPHFMATFSNGEHNALAGDGSITHMHYAGSGCTEHRGFGNVEPWRVPATPHNEVGAIPDGKELRWRYVSRGGGWVLVRDPAPQPNEPNWYFVQRGCVSLVNRD